ncbi:hypothetical protein M438DRAFT_36463 [Aureobasidium pullulans EXF-150]|uniref:Secreted protein n=1 Tax=Aureobasidium pullulans EXF-150 TaxID=1043002 RepID=A0A074Y9Q1_AURPU|nr:uncharacterized protein M438DRAFT_36463 [Aureobasidium pullulans EXF-150]KEQ83576.1 hypothetical protein M438DRAFT_36463 [Aureobasidium pullulans EXF-150]
MRLCTLVSLLQLLTVKSAWHNGPRGRSSSHERRQHLPLLPRHLGIPIISRLGNLSLVDLLLWVVHPTSPCNEKVGRRSWVACAPCLGCSCLSTCVQPPPSNIRYLLAFGTIVNRF